MSGKEGGKIMSKINYRDCSLFFLKIMLIMWWIILGIIIIPVTFLATNGYMALIGLFIMSIWVSISCTAVYWSNKYDKESDEDKEVKDE